MVEERKSQANWSCRIGLVVAVVGVGFAVFAEATRPRSDPDPAPYTASDLLLEESMRAKLGASGDAREFTERVLDKAKRIRQTARKPPPRAEPDEPSRTTVHKHLGLVGFLAGILAGVLAVVGWWKRGESRRMALLAGLAGVCAILLSALGVAMGGVVILAVAALAVAARFRLV